MEFQVCMEFMYGCLLQIHFGTSVHKENTKLWKLSRNSIQYLCLEVYKTLFLQNTPKKEQVHNIKHHNIGRFLQPTAWVVWPTCP